MDWSTAHKMSVVMREPASAHRDLMQVWVRAKALLMAGHRLVLEVREDVKSREQERRYHAMIGEVAAQAAHLGSKWGPEDWKRLLLDAFARETGRSHGRVIPNLSGSGMVEVGIQSRKFTKSDASEFIEWLHAWGAHNGVQFREWVDQETGEVLR